jgi:hypothetical protein
MNNEEPHKSFPVFCVGKLFIFVSRRLDNNNKEHENTLWSKEDSSSDWQSQKRNSKECERSTEILLMSSPAFSIPVSYFLLLKNVR